jgi:mitotic spindle assembly checkpoint protein MAD1
MTEITALQSTITELTTANTTLDAEVTDLMRRVASGEYNPAKERCIEFANNPAAKEKTIRRAELDALRKENEVLLEEIQALEDNQGIKAGEGFVPRESWERLRKEKEEMEAGHTKRLQRLKEVSPLITLPLGTP